MTRTTLMWHKINLFIIEGNINSPLLTLEDTKNVVQKHIKDEKFPDTYLFHTRRYFSSIKYIHNPNCQIVYTEDDLRHTIDILVILLIILSV